MNELQAMQAFAQVVDGGSFANAARTMDVAPAVVTRLIKDLEEHLGARLLTRTTRRVALTEIGARYLERVRPILGAVDDAVAVVRQSHSQPSGVLRVRVPPDFAAQQLMPRLARFHAAHPLVTVELAAGGPVESIDQDHDVTIVVRQPGLDGRFVARLLARSEMVLCATPAYLDRHGRPTHPSQLADHDLFMPGPRKALSLVRHPSASHPGPSGTETVVPRRSPLNMANPELHRAGALADLGIVGLPSFSIADALSEGGRSGRLERVLPDWRLHDLAIWACVPTRQHMPASTRAFLDFLVVEFGGRDCDPWLTQRRASPLVEELGLRAA